MDKVTWLSFLGILLLIVNLLNLYNSAHAAQKNAHAPLQKLEERIKKCEEHLTGIDYAMNDLKRDLDHAHQKIRENEQTASKIAQVQNKALLAILLWIKDPQHGDSKAIDDAIQGISTI